MELVCGTCWTNWRVGRNYETPRPNGTSQDQLLFFWGGSDHEKKQSLPILLVKCKDRRFPKCALQERESILVDRATFTCRPFDLRAGFSFGSTKATALSPNRFEDIVGSHANQAHSSNKLVYKKYLYSLKLFILTNEMVVVTGRSYCEYLHSSGPVDLAVPGNLASVPGSGYVGNLRGLSLTVAVIACVLTCLYVHFLLLIISHTQVWENLGHYTVCAVFPHFCALRTRISHTFVWEILGLNIFLAVLYRLAQKLKTLLSGSEGFPTPARGLGVGD
jgi:hypothetical protein